MTTTITTEAGNTTHVDVAARIAEIAAGSDHSNDHHIDYAAAAEHLSGHYASLDALDAAILDLIEADGTWWVPDGVAVALDLVGDLHYCGEVLTATGTADVMAIAERLGHDLLITGDSHAADEHQRGEIGSAVAVARQAIHDAAMEAGVGGRMLTAAEEGEAKRIARRGEDNTDEMAAWLAAVGLDPAEAAYVLACYR